MSMKKEPSTVEQPLLLFFLLSAAGWLWEVLFVRLSTGETVNRGFLHGPWLPVYGTGGVLILFLLSRLRGAPLIFLSALVGGSVEFAASLLLEALFRTRWWDYSSWPFDLDGRVCLGSAAAFGLAGWFLVRLLGPGLVQLLGILPSRLRERSCQVFCVLFVLDAAVSFAVPNTGAGISFPV